MDRQQNPKLNTLAKRAVLADYEILRDEIMCSRQPHIVIANNNPETWVNLGTACEAIFNYYPVQKAQAPSPRVYLVSTDGEWEDRGYHCFNLWNEDARDFKSQSVRLSKEETDAHILTLVKPICADIVEFGRTKDVLPVLSYFHGFVGAKTPRIHSTIFFVDDLADTEDGVYPFSPHGVEAAFQSLVQVGCKPFIFHPYKGKNPVWGDIAKLLQASTRAAGGALYVYKADDMAALKDGLTAVTLCATSLPFLIKGMVNPLGVTTPDGTALANRLAKPYRELDLKL